MCLTTNNPVIKVAEKNMVVYKTIADDGCSANKNFRYFKEEVNPDVILISHQYSPNRPFQVDRGYHSAPSPKTTGDGRANSVFVIPKGASYIEGYNNGSNTIQNYVSSTIIFIGRIDTPWQRFFTNRRLKKYIK